MLGGSVAFEGLLYICRTGLWVTPLSYVTCIDMACVASGMSHASGNAGHWSCALAHWNRTAEYISADEEPAKECPMLCSPLTKLNTYCQKIAYKRYITH